MKISFGKLGVGAALVLATVSPAAAIAGNGHGNGQTKTHGNTTAPGHTKTHTVTYVFKGTWNTGDSSVTVKHGNAHVRKAGFVGQTVAFDISGAKLVVADTNADGSRTSADLKDGDNVVVKARLPRKDPGTQPFKARMLIDQSSRPAGD
jgi:hypothetical protein